jgi:hypothetical protein
MTIEPIFEMLIVKVAQALLARRLATEGTTLKKGYSGLEDIARMASRYFTVSCTA